MTEHSENCCESSSGKSQLVTDGWGSWGCLIGMKIVRIHRHSFYLRERKTKCLQKKKKAKLKAGNKQCPSSQIHLFHLIDWSVHKMSENSEECHRYLPNLPVSQYDGWFARPGKRTAANPHVWAAVPSECFLLKQWIIIINYQYSCWLIFCWLTRIIFSVLINSFPGKQQALE